MSINWEEAFKNLNEEYRKLCDEHEACLLKAAEHHKRMLEHYPVMGLDAYHLDKCHRKILLNINNSYIWTGPMRDNYPRVRYGNGGKQVWVTASHILLILDYRFPKELSDQELHTCVSLDYMYGR